MSNKIKKVINTKPFYFILGALIFGTIGVSAATYFPSNDVIYDNTESGLQSKNVQGAIDELYGICFPPSPSTAADSILNISKVVTSGDGLYEDEYEDGRYIFKGNNPNNYLTFNGETAGWRIISVENDGTIKIIRNKFLSSSQHWNSYNANEWENAQLNYYLNNSYISTITESNKIKSHNWSIGEVSEWSSDLYSQIVGENNSKFEAKIGLITVSEYIRASTNKNQCGTLELINDNFDICQNSNWMYTEDNWWWTISADANNKYQAIAIFPDGNGSVISGAHVNSGQITGGDRPTFYIASDVIFEGTGTESKPFEIVE